MKCLFSYLFSIRDVSPSIMSLNDNGKYLFCKKRIKLFLTPSKIVNLVTHFKVGHLYNVVINRCGSQSASDSSERKEDQIHGSGVLYYIEWQIKILFTFMHTKLMFKEVSPILFIHFLE